MPTCSNLSTEGKTFFANVANHFTDSTLRLKGMENILLNF